MWQAFIPPARAGAAPGNVAVMTSRGHSPADRLPVEAYTLPDTYAPTRRPVDQATTLIPDAYTSEAFYALEQERIFATSWVHVATTSDFETVGDTVVADVAGRSIVVVMADDGRLNGFHNVCRHRGTELADAGCRHVGRAIRCPYHAWAYDLGGACIGTPLFTGSEIPEDQQGVFDMSDAEGFDRAAYDLFPVRVETWGFMVFVNLSVAAAPLADHLGDLPARTAGYRLEDWRVVADRTYDIAANHKLVGENFMEYYHLPWVHPELVKVSRLRDHYRWQGAGMYTGMTTWPISQNSDAGGWQGLTPAPYLSGADAEAGRFIWLFPNVAVNLLPNHALLLTAQPAGPDRTIEQLRLLIPGTTEPGTATDDGVANLLDFWHLVNTQDIEIVERVQRGLSNPAYEGGPMCYRFEEPVHRFQNMVIDRMLGIERVPEGDDEEHVPMFEQS